MPKIRWEKEPSREKLEKHAQEVETDKYFDEINKQIERRNKLRQQSEQQQQDPMQQQQVGQMGQADDWLGLDRYSPENVPDLKRDAGKDPDEERFLGGALDEIDLSFGGLSDWNMGVLDILKEGREEHPAEAHMLGEATFGTAGAMVGSGLGPAGAVGGGAGGVALFNQISGIIDGEEATENFQQSISRGYEDAMWGMGLSSVGPALRRTLGHFAGFDEQQIRRASDEMREISPEHQEATMMDRMRARVRGEEPEPDMPAQMFLGDRGMFPGFQKVVGVFPFVGSPLHKGKERIGRQLESEVDSYLNTVAPNAGLSFMGVDVADATRRSHQSFKNVAEKNYEQAFDIARKLGDPEVVPMARTRKVIDELNQAFHGSRPQELPEPPGTEVTSYLQYLRQMDREYISPTEVRQVSADLNRMFGNTQSGTDRRMIGQIKETLEESLLDLHDPLEMAQGQLDFDIMGQQGARQMRPQDVGREMTDQASRQAAEEGVDPQHAERIARSRGVLTDDAQNLGVLENLDNMSRKEALDVMRGAFNFSNQFYSAGLAHTKGPLGQRGVFRTKATRAIKQADPEALGQAANNPPSLSEDQVMHRLFQQRSPDTMKEVRDIVGNEEMGRLAGEYIDGAARAARNKAAQNMNMSFREFEKALGIGDERGRQTFRSMTEGTNINARKIEKLVDLGKQVEGMSLRESSTFVQRRALLAGVSGLTGLAATMAAPSHLTISLPAMGLAYMGSRALGSRRMLDNYLKALDPGADFAARRSAAATILNDMPNQIFEEAFGVGTPEIEQLEEATGQPKGDALIFGAEDAEEIEEDDEVEDMEEPAADPELYGIEPGERTEEGPRRGDRIGTGLEAFR